MEGMLIWLDADSLIRERSQGARSLDDFARAFFGVNDRDWGELTYDFDDVVRTLNQVQPYDWASFLHTRLSQVSAHAPLDGVTRGGYQLVYTNAPTEWFKASEKARKTTSKPAKKAPKPGAKKRPARKGKSIKKAASES